MKLIILIFMGLLCQTALFSQISFGGMPLWQGEMKSSNSSIPFEKMPKFNRAKYMVSDSYPSKTTHFAHPFLSISHPVIQAYGVFSPMAPAFGY